MSAALCDTLRALALPHVSAHARDVLALPWPLRSIALAVRDGDPLRHRTTAEHAADHAIAYTLAAEVYPASAARYTRVAAGWLALVVGEAAVRATGAEPAGAWPAGGPPIRREAQRVTIRRRRRRRPPRRPSPGVGARRPSSAALTGAAGGIVARKPLRA